LANSEEIVEFVREIILIAIKEKASDIHIEPKEKTVRVGFRIDGVLYEILTLEKNTHLPLLSRLKILSNMNIVEKRKPQDGHFTFYLSQRRLILEFQPFRLFFGKKLAKTPNGVFFVTCRTGYGVAIKRTRNWVKTPSFSPNPLSKKNF